MDFVAADMPDANRLTIHIIAAVAESVGRTISENTRTALAAAKARGVKLGNPNGARALKGKQVDRCRGQDQGECFAARFRPRRHRSQISMLKSMQLNPPFEELPPSLAAFNDDFKSTGAVRLP